MFYTQDTSSIFLVLIFQVVRHFYYYVIDMTRYLPFHDFALVGQFKPKKGSCPHASWYLSFESPYKMFITANLQQHLQRNKLTWICPSEIFCCNWSSYGAPSRWLALKNFIDKNKICLYIKIAQNVHNCKSAATFTAEQTNLNMPIGDFLLQLK